MLQINISKRAAIIVALALVLVIPGVAGATHIFDDVAVTLHTHAEGIEWLAGAGVTAWLWRWHQLLPGSDRDKQSPDGYVHVPPCRVTAERRQASMQTRWMATALRT